MKSNISNFYLTTSLFQAKKVSENEAVIPDVTNNENSSLVATENSEATENITFTTVSLKYSLIRKIYKLSCLDRGNPKKAG